jgi:TetR/AcrR family transcriptional regulator, transcriptional repressor for nem operon
MRYDTDHKDKTRDKVLKAAAKAIRAQGPHRIAVAAVMAKAGLTHGGFYAHFDSKDDLIAAAIERMFDELYVRASERFRDQDPAAGLSAFIDFYLSTAHRDAIAAGCPIPILAPELHRLTQQARTRFAAGVTRLMEVLSTNLARLGHEDAAAQASSMLAELLGALSLARAEPVPSRSDEILAISRRALKSRLKLAEHS